LSRCQRTPSPTTFIVPHNNGIYKLLFAVLDIMGEPKVHDMPIPLTPSCCGLELDESTGTTGGVD
jgi:hypothetical protein